MQTIQELLNRIRWDPEFGEGVFEIGYLDHIEHIIIRIPFNKISFAPKDHFFFYYIDNEGIEHSIPFHRIKSVYKNDTRIWHREH